MEVLGVLLVWGVLGLCVEGVDSKQSTDVKKEVEKIFKTVDELMTGKSYELRRTSKTPTTVSSVTKEERRRTTEKEVPTVLPSLLKPLARSYTNPIAPFPVGIVVSDHLYPMVVGRNAETGKPFVVNLEKQHAMIVASGASGYRMLIPFPAMVGTPKLGGFDEEDPPLLPAPDYRNYPSKSMGFSSSHSSFSPEGRNTPREPVQDFSARPLNKNQHYRKNDEEPYSEEPRYNKHPMKSPKKYIFTTNPNVRSRGKPPGSSSYGSFAPDSRPRASPMRPAYLTNPEKSLSYYVEGPKFNPPPMPFAPKKSIPITYRQPNNPYSINGPKYRSYMSPGAPGTSRNSHYRNYYNEHPVYSSSQDTPKYPPAYASVPRHPSLYGGAPRHPMEYGSVPRNPTVYGSVPKDFKPSPYLGEIDTYNGDDGDRDAEETTTLQPQSELFESYDERGEEMKSENDFDDTASDSPEGRHASSGGVRHVTYHADDYLGKIYEEMYYRLPSTERIDTNPDANLHSRSPQIFPHQDYEDERTSTATETADRRIDQVRAPQTHTAERRLDQNLPTKTEPNNDTKTAATKR